MVDCLTLLASNLMREKDGEAALFREIRRLLAALKKGGASAAIVSNELGLGIVPANAPARRFRDAAGRANQIAAERADQVFFMVAGIPWRLK